MVIDSNDPSRLPLAREELHRLCADEVRSRFDFLPYPHSANTLVQHRLFRSLQALKNALLLVYANKQDLPTAMKPAQVSEGLGLTELRDRQSRHSP